MVTSLNKKHGLDNMFLAVDTELKIPTTLTVKFKSCEKRI